MRLCCCLCGGGYGGATRTEPALHMAATFASVSLFLLAVPAHLLAQVLKVDQGSPQSAMEQCMGSLATSRREPQASNSSPKA